MIRARAKRNSLGLSLYRKHGLIKLPVSNSAEGKRMLFASIFPFFSLDVSVPHNFLRALARF
jgi:hypothetical protein